MSSNAVVWPDLKSKIPRINLALKQAFAEAEEQGHQQGFENGQKAGREAAAAELSELRDRYGKAVQTLDVMRLKVEADQVRALAATVQHGARREVDSHRRHRMLVEDVVGELRAQVALAAARVAHQCEDEQLPR